MQAMKKLALTPLSTAEIEPNEAPVRPFTDGEFYSIAEIAERMKCGLETVKRRARRHGLKYMNFGCRQYLGRDLNRLLEQLWKAD